MGRTDGLLHELRLCAMAVEMCKSRHLSNLKNENTLVNNATFPSKHIMVIRCCNNVLTTSQTFSQHHLTMIYSLRYGQIRDKQYIFSTKASCVLNETCIYYKQQVIGNQDVSFFTVLV